MPNALSSIYGERQAYSQMNSDGFFSTDDVQKFITKANIAWKPSSQFMEYTKALFKALLQDNMENKVPGKAVVSLFRKTSCPTQL